MARQTFYFPIHNSDPKVSKRPWVIGCAEEANGKWYAGYIRCPTGSPMTFRSKMEILPHFETITAGRIINQTMHVCKAPSLQERIDFVQASVTGGKT